MSDRRQASRNYLAAAIQKESGGCLKAMNVTVFVDPQGNIVGMSEIKVVKLFPQKLAFDIPANASQLADLLMSN
jgi:hypothetical protein